MNVLVTGASGFIGRPLVRRLLARGHRVRALVRRPEERGAVLGADYAIGDMRDAASLDRAAESLEGIVHLACATGVAREALVRAVNVEGTRLLLEAAARNGVRRFVFISSVSATRARVGPYGRSKREGEALVAGSGLEAVILRPALVYGPGASGLFARLSRALRALPVVPVIGGSGIVDPIHVDDLCAVIEQCLGRADVTGKTYDVLGPDRLTFEALLRRIAAALGVEARLVPVPGAVALPVAWTLGLLLQRPPLSVDQVFGLTSPARVDGEPARRDFRIPWTSLEAGLTGFGQVARP